MKTFSHDLIVPKYKMKQLNPETGRYYIEQGDLSGRKFPSITSVLSAYEAKDYSDFPERIKRRAAERGTKMHDFCERYILNELELPIPISKNLKEATAHNMGRTLFYQLKKMLDLSVECVYMSETQLKSNKFLIAGTIDLFAKIKGKNVVLDYKSSTSRKNKEDIDSYFAQGSFYSEAIEETFPGVKVDGVMILISTESEGVQNFYLNRNKGEHKPYLKHLIEARKEFYKLKGF